MTTMTTVETQSNGLHHDSATEAESAASRRRILIVEDDDQARRQLKQLLDDDPQLEVLTANDGKQALTALRESEFSILITDLRMPNLDGMALIQAIQQDRLPVTVIVTTGDGSIDEAVQALRMGAYDFLTKPI